MLPRRGCFFAVRNPGAARELTLAVNWKALGIGNARVVAVTGCKIRGVDAAGLRLSVPARWTAVVAVNRTDADRLAAAHRRELEQFRVHARAKTP